jgi:uncharacterized protein YciI
MTKENTTKQMEHTSGYLPDDPRYGLSGEALKDYYRQKPAQWVIQCSDKPDTGQLRARYYPDHRKYLEKFTSNVVGCGPILSDDATHEIGHAFFIELPHRENAEVFIAEEPFARAGVYETVRVLRWSNSFLKRMEDYNHKPGQQLFFLIASKRRGINSLLREHLHDHESYFKKFEDNFVFRGPIRSEDGTENYGSAIVMQLPDRQAMDDFWNNEPYNSNGVYEDDLTIYRLRFGDDST